MSLLEGPYAGSGLRAVDRNPAKGLPAAARELCCTSHGDPCPKSVNFAKYVARRRHDPSLDRILGNQSFDDRRIRSILMLAHAQDGNELMSFIRDDPTVFRRQIARANMVLTNLHNDREVKTETAYDTAALLVRMMVRDRFVDLDRLEPDLLAGALIALSADSLGAYVNDCAIPILEHAVSGYAETYREPESDGRLDSGIRAFVRSVGSTRKPLLTTRQLIWFSDCCARTRTHWFQVQQRQIPTCCPILPQLTEACRRMKHDDDAVVPLASVSDLNGEGKVMNHCLSNYGNYYISQLVMGNIAILSVRPAGDKRATLVLRPVLAHVSGKLVIQRWRTGEFQGPGNAKPRRSCRRLVKRLVKELDAQCPIPVPESERQRRQGIVEMLFPTRDINLDKEVADDAWREFYLTALPRRFSEVTPRELMASYFESLESKG